MCGISGIVTIKNSSIPLDYIKQMTTSLRHRYPDNEGFFYLQPAGNIWQLGFVTPDFICVKKLKSWVEKALYSATTYELPIFKQNKLLS